MVRHQQDIHERSSVVYKCNGCKYAKFGRRDMMLMHCRTLRHEGFSVVDVSCDPNAVASVQRYHHNTVSSRKKTSTTDTFGALPHIQQDPEEYTESVSSPEPRALTSFPGECLARGLMNVSSKALQASNTMVHQENNESSRMDGYSERGTTSNYSSYFLQSKKERLKHECPICFRKVLARSLNRHMATLHCKQAFPCEYCDRAFTRKDTRAWHTTEKHSKTRRLVSKKRTSYGNTGLLDPFTRAPRECD
jgi:hypothetical protein